MPRYIHSFLLPVFLSIVFIACHSDSNKVQARPVPTPPTSRFHETPKSVKISPLAYDTLGPLRSDMIRRLDAFYNTQARTGFNGSVLIGYKGKVLYERYYGLANRERRLPLSPSSACQLASISKTLTGAAVLYLYDRKYLDINDPVQKYIKDFPYPDITVKMLLDHRSGLQDYRHWVPLYRTDTRTPISNEMMLQMMARYKPGLSFRPNTRFTYCNTNYAVLARIIEVVSEMNYRVFMKRYIFDPLGMSNTFVYDPEKGLPASATLSYRYNWAKEPDMFADGVYGDKGTYSTVEDM